MGGETGCAARHRGNVLIQLLYPDRFPTSSGSKSKTFVGALFTWLLPLCSIGSIICKQTVEALLPEEKVLLAEVGWRGGAKRVLE